MADLEKRTGAAPAVQAGQSDIDSLPALFGRLGDDVMRLVDTKLSLLKVEVKEDALFYARSGAFMGIGGVFAAVGLALLNVALAFAISLLLPSDWSQPARYAVGFVITGVLYLIIGGVIIIMMKNRIARRDPVPNRSVEELRKDKQWLKNEI
jgi:uncharacterized membrane protein YqjE